jgi:site-specific DNA-methyltransferase (adenine-specific)
MIDLRLGDCIEVLKTLEDNSVDSIVTDPPYHLTSIVKRFGKEGSAPAKFGTDGAFARASKGFMGKEWDGGDIAFRTDVWSECLRVLKPGGHLLSFGGSRTYHRMAVAIEDAGFEIRDQIMWVYASGFPKSHNIGKAIDKMDVDNEWEGWGTALKPAHEPICMARKPLSEKTIAENVLKHGTGGINIDDCRIGSDEELGRFPANIIFDEEAGKILDEQSGKSKTKKGIPYEYKIMNMRLRDL